MSRFTTACRIALCCFACNSLLSSPGIAADQYLYLSAGGKITVSRIDETSGKLIELQEIDLPGAGPLGTSPDRRLLYATASEGRDPAIATFQVAQTGALQHVTTAKVNLRPGYLRTDSTGSYLAGNHYGEGKVTVWKLAAGVYRGETVQEVALEEKAHSTVFSPNNRWLLVPATGPNKVFQNRFDQNTGILTANDPPFATGPQNSQDARQPRHLIFHPRLNVVYTTNERERPGVGVWTWDGENGKLQSVQNIVSQPADFSGVITTADLHLTPDARFLYISNRDVTDRQARTGQDAIVAFSVDSATGRLTLNGHFPCEHVPRSFIVDEAGRYLYVAGQGDDRLGVYRIHEKTGALSKVTQYETGARPSWVHCMSPPAP